MGVVGITSTFPAVCFNRRELASAAPAIQESPDTNHCRHSAAAQILQWRRSVEHRIGVRTRGPLVRQTLSEKDIERLENAYEERDACEFVLREQALAMALQFKIAPM